MKRLLDRFNEIWCTHMHGKIMWPFEGRYRCQTCFREYPVPFEQPVQRAYSHNPGLFVVAAAERRA